MDIVGRFVEENIFFKPGVTVLAKTVYRNYTEWCKANGNFPMNSRRFHTEFKKRFGGKVTWRDVEAGLQYEGGGVKPGGTLGYEDV
jgi:phage/plasmid-associated DNA primase